MKRLRKNFKASGKFAKGKDGRGRPIRTEEMNGVRLNSVCLCGRTFGEHYVRLCPEAHERKLGIDKLLRKAGIAS